LETRAVPEKHLGAGAATALPRSGAIATWLARGQVRDTLVCLGFLLLAGWVTNGLWPNPGGRILALNPPDQILYEWFLAHGTRVWNGDFALVTDRLNAPDGVNLLANTTVIALGALFTPITVLFGAPTTFAVIVGLNLAGTAAAWYLLFRRTMGAGTWAGNSISDNLSYRHFLNITRVARVIPPRVPTEQQLWGHYFDTYGR